MTLKSHRKYRSGGPYGAQAKNSEACHMETPKGLQGMEEQVYGCLGACLGEDVEYLRGVEKLLVNYHVSVKHKASDKYHPTRLLKALDIDSARTPSTSPKSYVDRQLSAYGLGNRQDLLTWSTTKMYTFQLVESCNFSKVERRLRRLTSASTRKQSSHRSLILCHRIARRATQNVRATNSGP